MGMDLKRNIFKHAGVSKFLGYVLLCFEVLAVKFFKTKQNECNKCGSVRLGISEYGFMGSALRLFRSRCSGYGKCVRFKQQRHLKNDTKFCIVSHIPDICFGC
jgi:hypothetical protein